MATETIEQGLEEAQAAFVRQGGGEVHEDQELTWVFSGNSLVFASSVIRTRIRASDPDQVIAMMLAWFRAAIAMLYPAKQVAVIDEVSTIPAMRGQGIATAATLTALRDAQMMGYRTAVLVASEAGARVYLRLGFVPYGKRRVYIWQPEGN